jgi:uncharacterized membrane protein
MFVVRDISGFYLAMRHSQNVLVVSLVVVLTLDMLLILAQLSRVIFRRLEHHRGRFARRWCRLRNRNPGQLGG